MRGLLATWIMVMTLLCFALAPIIVAATHGPAAAAEAAAVLAHGHSHGDLDQSGGHDATDHEHQLSALLPPRADLAPLPPRDLQLIENPAVGANLPDGLRRPPRV
jgi:hypothetical protein